MDQHLASTPGINRQEVSIRPMRPSDRASVIDLDARVWGKTRAAYFERRLAALEHADTSHHLIFLAADYRDAIIGFVMGTLTSGEFGLAQVTAILDSIAVHPRYQRQHLGQQLIEAFLRQGADAIQTRWSDFCAAATARRSPMQIGKGWTSMNVLYHQACGVGAPSGLPLCGVGVTSGLPLPFPLPFPLPLPVPPPLPLPPPVLLTCVVWAAVPSGFRMPMLCGCTLPRQLTVKR